MTENSLRKSLMTFRGNLSNIFDKPIALAFLSLALAVVIIRILYPLIFQRTRSDKI
jgi:TctA family transporter